MGFYCLGVIPLGWDGCLAPRSPAPSSEELLVTHHTDHFVLSQTLKMHKMLLPVYKASLKSVSATHSPPMASALCSCPCGAELGHVPVDRLLSRGFPNERPKETQLGKGSLSAVTVCRHYPVRGWALSQSEVGRVHLLWGPVVLGVLKWPGAIPAAHTQVPKCTQEAEVSCCSIPSPRSAKRAEHPVAAAGGSHAGSPCPGPDSQ